MQKGKLVIALSVIILIASCTSPYIYRIEPQPTSTRYQTSKYSPPIKPFRQVAILPFADHSETTFLQDRGYPGNAVVEAIADQLVAHNVKVIPQEDTDRLLIEWGFLPGLVEMGVIPEAQSLLYNGPHTFNHELDHHNGIIRQKLKEMGYSDDLMWMVDTNEGDHRHRGGADAAVTTDADVRLTNKVKTRNVYGMSTEDLVNLAQQLGVDAVVRGRILEYGLKKTPTIDPAYGFGIVNRLMMGLEWLVYDDKDDGDYAADEPREEIRHDIDRFRVNPFGSPFSVFTRILGPSNIKSSAIVQIRVYVQDARTGEVIWTNRAEVETTPFSVFSFDDMHLKNLFDDATEKAAKEVMSSFFYARQWEEMHEKVSSGG